MKNPATPANTAVCCLLAYPSNEIPATYGFCYQTAQRLKIPLTVFGRGEKYDDGLPRPHDQPVPTTYHGKVNLVSRHVKTLPASVEYVIIFDARDCLFLRPLQFICDEFNKMGWPIVMGAEQLCGPHWNEAWKNRFRKFRSGCNFPNTGMYMGERRALERAFAKVAEMSELVKNGKVESSVECLDKDDQHLWQACYLDQTIPMRLDHESKIFMNAAWTPYEDFDFTKSTEETPIVLKSGSAPAMIHFCYCSSQAIPFFAWTFNLVPLPQ